MRAARAVVRVLSEKPLTLRGLYQWRNFIDEKK